MQHRLTARPLRGKPLPALAICEMCGEYRKPALKYDVKGRVICFNCDSTYTRGKPLHECFLCRETAFSERHHVLRRKYSELSVWLCCNCHRLATYEKEYELLPLAVAGRMIKEIGIENMLDDSFLIWKESIDNED